MPSAPKHTMWRPSAHFAAALVVVLASTLTGCDLFSGATDERAPSVEILRPGDRNVVGSSVRFRIAATPRQSDDNYISFVNVTVNGQQAGEAEYIQGTTTPYIFQFDWDSFKVPDGEYRIEAIAFDKFQARGLSNELIVVVKNESAGEGPEVEIVTPRDGDIVSGTERIIAEPKDGQPAITKLDFLIDGATVATVDKAPFSYDWDTTAEPGGNHTIRVRAFSADDVFKYSDPIDVEIAHTDSTIDSTRANVAFTANGFSGEVKGSVAIGFNNDIYFGTLTGKTKDTLYAYTPTGRIRWKAVTGPLRSSPVVGNNEDVFITSEDGRLYGFTSMGKQLWPAYNTNANLRSSPAYGIEGGLFFGDSDGKIHGVSSFDGLPIEGFPTQVTNVPIIVAPVITRDRTIIVAATDGHIYALRPDGTRLWKSSANVGSVSTGMAVVEQEFEVTLPNGQVARSKHTVVYVVSNNGRIYALTVDTNGSINWEYQLTGPTRTSPIVGPDGAIYIGTSTGLMVLEETVDQFTPRLRYIHVAEDVGTPAIDANENVYFVAGKTLRALNPNNKPLWEFDLRMHADGPLTISRNGLLFVAGNNGVLYGIQTGSVGLARAKWPMFQRNSRHSGRIGIDETDG